MLKDNLITGLDIGSTAIRMVVGEKPRNESKIRIIGAVEGPSKGIAKGVVIDADDVISAVSGVLGTAFSALGRGAEKAAEAGKAVQEGSEAAAAAPR